MKALESVTVKSDLVLECLECLSELATHNSIQLVWVSGHGGILDNERADELAKKGADTPFTGPEPVLGLPNSVVKRANGNDLLHAKKSTAQTEIVVFFINVVH